MLDSADDVCGLSEVIDTEHVMEIMEENQFLDLAASMETRGEIAVATSSPISSAHEERETERRQLAGQKRKRGYLLTLYPTFLSFTCRSMQSVTNL